MHKSRTFVAHVDPSHQKRHRGTRHTDRKSHRRDQNRSRGDRFVELFDLYPSSGTNPKLHHHRGSIRVAGKFSALFLYFIIFFLKKKSSSKLPKISFVFFSCFSPQKYISHLLNPKKHSKFSENFQKICNPKNSPFLEFQRIFRKFF